MNNYLHAKISEISDPEFQSLIDELYHCVGIERDDKQLTTIYYVISSLMVQDAKALTSSHLPIKEVLLTKCVDKLCAGSVVHDLCRQIAGLQHKTIEGFDGKTVLYWLRSLVSKQLKVTKIRKSGRNALRHEAMKRVIDTRRQNGDL